MIIPRPQIEPIAGSVWDKPRFRLTADWIFTLDDGLPIAVPKGFETDLASIPRLLWAVPGFAPMGPLLCGSIVHDFGYQYGYLLSVFDSNRTYPEYSMSLRESYIQFLTSKTIPVFAGRNQKFFDQFFVGLTIDGTGQHFIANAAGVALKMFGKFAWDKYRKHGPAAYNINSLGLPGLTTSGVQF